jgi:uncharacterized membrane protein YgcG
MIMNDTDPSPAEKWRLQALVRSLSLQLQSKYGRQEYYLPDQVLKLCESLKIPQADQQYAVAAFLAPGDSDNLLQKFRSSKTTNEIRKFLAYQIGFGPGGGFDEFGFLDYLGFSHGSDSPSGFGGHDGGEGFSDGGGSGGGD